VQEAKVPRPGARAWCTAKRTPNLTKLLILEMTCGHTHTHTHTHTQVPYYTSVFIYCMWRLYENKCRSQLA
jgi:hypothetical protein